MDTLALVVAIVVGNLLGTLVAVSLIGLWLWRKLGRRLNHRQPDKMVADRDLLHARLEEMSEELDTYSQALERRINGESSSAQPPSPGHASGRSP